MKAFAVWYFEWGWLVATLLAVIVGVAVGNLGRVIASIVLLVLGFTMLYLKHS